MATDLCSVGNLEKVNLAMSSLEDWENEKRCKNWSNFAFTQGLKHFLAKNKTLWKKQFDWSLTVFRWSELDCSISRLKFPLDHAVKPSKIKQWKSLCLIVSACSEFDKSIGEIKSNAVPKKNLIHKPFLISFTRKLNSVSSEWFCTAPCFHKGP